MRTLSRKKRAFNEINVVPYVDVSLVLLLVFMITAPLIEQGVEVELPKALANQISTVNEEPIVITVDKSGLYYINLADEPDQPISTAEMLAFVSAVRRVNPKLPVFIRGAQDSAYGNVVNVFVILQQARVENVGLMTQNISP